MINICILYPIFYYLYIYTKKYFIHDIEDIYDSSMFTYNIDRILVMTNIYIVHLLKKHYYEQDYLNET